MKRYFFTLFVVTILVFATLFVANNFLDEYSLMVLSNLGIFIILAVSYNLINGVTGQFSLEPNGFVAIGAYVTALLLLSPEAKIDNFMMSDPSPLVMWMHSSFVPALLISGVVASLVALSLAFPVFRVRGDYLAIVTLGFGFIIRIIAINEDSYTNGSMGLNDIPEYANFLSIFAVAFVSVVLIVNIVYSKYGRAMKAIRDDEDVASAMGINTFKIKTIAFMTSAFFEGMAGGLMATLLTTISPEQFSFMLTFQILIMIVLGGLGSISGAIIGAILVTIGMEGLRFLDQPNLFGIESDAHPGLRMVVFSAILILIMLFARKGIMGEREIWDLFRKKDD